MKQLLKPSETLNLSLTISVIVISRDNKRRNKNKEKITQNNISHSRTFGVILNDFVHGQPFVLNTNYFFRVMYTMYVKNITSTSIIPPKNQFYHKFNQDIIDIFIVATRHAVHNQPLLC